VCHPRGGTQFDLLLAPPVRLVGLYPFKVRHDHTARVGEDVRRDESPVGIEDPISGLRNWVRASCS
jgi:hypothetical protein